MIQRKKDEISAGDPGDIHAVPIDGGGRSRVAVELVVGTVRRVGFFLSPDRLAVTGVQAQDLAFCLPGRFTCQIQLALPVDVRRMAASRQINLPQILIRRYSRGNTRRRDNSRRIGTSKLCPLRFLCWDHRR